MAGKYNRPLHEDPRPRRRRDRHLHRLVPRRAGPRGRRGRPAPGAGLETSFANGGQISVSHSEPWANPDAPFKLLKWLAQSDSPLLFRLRMDPHQW